MCTVVCRWEPGGPVPVRVLALRDELRSRPFDLPGRWWPDHPTVVGGRDRRAGGSWCVTDVAAGVTAVVLNRPEKRDAAPGAPSRGVLPLLAAQYGSRWAEHVDVPPMAGFSLVVVTPGSLEWWSYDGRELRHEPLPAGTVMFTPTGRADRVADPRLLERPAIGAPDEPTPPEAAWRPWLNVVRAARPTADRVGLLVRHPIPGDSYETVFGQLIASTPGVTRVDCAPWLAEDPTRSWTASVWAA